MKHLTFISVFLVLLITLPAQAASVQTKAKQAIIVDMETGQVLFEKESHARMPTSSMSKVITIYEVFTALKDGRLKRDDMVNVSEKAWKMGGSRMFIEPGKPVKVEDLIRGVIIQSGNDAAVALGETLGGNEDAFADMLNETAAQLGMNDSHFMNASGWPDPNHYATAADLAVLAEHLIKDFPDEYHYFSEKEFTYNNITQANRDPLLYKNIGADGIKTGHTDSGGYGLMASGMRDGRRVIMVLNGMESLKDRAEESTRLLDWALRSFQNKTILTAGETLEDIPVAMSVEKTIPVTTATDLRVSVPKAHKNQIVITTTYKENLTAPITQGAEVGTLAIDVPGYTSPILRPLIAGAPATELGFFGQFLEKTKTAVMNAIR